MLYKFFNNTISYFNKRSKYILLSPNYKSFGNCSEEIFYGILKAEKEKKKLLLIYPKIPFLNINLINKELFYLEHPRIHRNFFLQNFFSYLCGIYLLILNVTDKLRKILLKKTYINISANRIPSLGKNDLWLPKNETSFIKEKALKQNWPKQYKNYIAPKITEPKMIYAQNKLYELGLPKNAWFVCVHVPETIKVENVRQASIKNYIPMIQHITKNGGWVVRIGDRNNPKLPDIKNVIDYANNEENNALVNLFAISKCKFFVGVTSGPSLVAALFKKYVVGTNRTQVAHDYPFNLSITKHIYDSEKKHFLSINDLLNASSETQFFEEKDSHYVLYENSADEILQITKEAMSRKPPSDLMKTFDKKIRATINRFIDEEGYPVSWNAVDKDQMYIYKYRAYAESPLCLKNSFFSHNFLENNWDSSSYNTDLKISKEISSIISTDK